MLPQGVCWRTTLAGSAYIVVVCRVTSIDATFYRSLFWFLFAFGAVVLVFLVLFLPETLRSLVGNGSIPARGINRSGVSIWHEHQQRKRQGPRDKEAEAASLAAKPPQKGWKDVRPFAPLKMFREKDVVCVLVFNAITYTSVH